MTWMKREEVKALLARWPIQGRTIKRVETFDVDAHKPVWSEIDEYGNHWMHGECLTQPPKLPLSWVTFQENMRTVMLDAGLDPALLEKYETLYKSS